MLNIQRGNDGWSNNVLQQIQKQTLVYYLPCYLRLKLKNFISIDLQTLSGEINAVIVFSVYYGGLSKQLADFLFDNIILQFSRGEAIQLKECLQISVKKVPRKKLYSFTVRRFLNTGMECNLFLSPFELIYLIVTVTVRSISYMKSDDHEVLLRFNLMDHPNKFVKLSFTQEDVFGNYKLAYSLIDVAYKNQNFYDPKKHHPIHQEDQKQGATLISIDNFADQSVKDIVRPQHTEPINYFQYAHFNIPLYKIPVASLSAIFLPIWCMCIYNLFIFFQERDMTMRISNGATLTLALYAFSPTIREQLPPTPNILLVQIFIYLLGFTFIFSLLQGYVVSTQDQDWVFVWYQSGWFIVSVVICSLTFIIVNVLMCMHKFKWEPSYRRELPQFTNDQRKFNLTDWKNRQCDQYFQNLRWVRIVQ